MESRIIEIALAALLHDIGKVEQRAREDPWNPPEDIRDSGQPVHAAWSMRVASLAPQKYRSAILAGGYHHQPERLPTQDQFLSKLVALSDKLSAGERSDLPKDYKVKKPPQQLVSIFDRILRDGGKQVAEHYLPVAPLSLDAIGKYIHSDKRASENVRGGYDDLRLTLENAVKQDIQDGATYLEHILAEMQRLTWCVPSAYYHSVADVSLYDHSRMSAALAVCMADFSEEQIDSLLKSIRDAFNDGNQSLPDTEVALLVGGDISGVQNFIYTIASKGAARMLRGRSFYLQLLTEAVLRFVLRRLGLPYTNVIYSGGGHFYLLAPLSAREELSRIQTAVGNILLQQHGTQLYLVLGSAPIPAKGFRAGALSDYWQKMHDQLAFAKNRRYAELQQDLYTRVFGVAEYGGNPEKTCSVCGDDQRGAGNWDEWNEAQSKICPLCRSFAESIGQKLPDAQFLTLKFSEPQDTNDLVDSAFEILQMFGMKVEFARDAKSKIDAEKVRQVVLWALDDPRDDKWPQTSIPAARWFRYTANRVPMVRDKEHADRINNRLGNVTDQDKAHPGQPMTFTHLNVLSTSCFERLGVLRMDVDNLGSIFKEGLGKSFSLSRLATLSFQMSIFFEGWLIRIVEAKDWNNLVYTVYSGGDDLFLLAPWDRVPPLAQKIADDFAAYTGHPGLHISGGMAFIDGKYPIYQAAEDAAEAEGLAKDLAGKNAFAFLNRAWKWDAFRDLAERKDVLAALVQGEGNEEAGPKSILHTLRALAEMEVNAVAQKGRPVWGRWMWYGAYQLVRMEERYKNNAALKEKIANLHTSLGNFQNLEIWGAAARWAQLQTRKRKDGK